MRTAKFAVMAGAAAAAVGASAVAAPTIFFGETVNLNANHDTVPLASWPAATAASAAFGLIVQNRQIFSFEQSEGVNFSSTYPAPAAPATGVNPAVNFNNGVTASITNGVVRYQAPGTAGPSGPENPGQTPEGRYPTTGTQYLAASTSNLRLDFNQPVNAFGFFGIDIGDFGGTLTLTTTGGLNMQFVVNHTVGSNGSTSGSVLFWGIIDAQMSFTSVQFSNNNASSDVFAFDDFTIGTLPQIIPLPTGAGLGSVGLIALGGMGFARRRRA